MKDVAITKIDGRTKDGILIYDNDGTIKTNYTLSYKDETLRVKR